MHLALTDIFSAHWCADVLEEWMRNLLKNRPDLNRQNRECLQTFAALLLIRRQSSRTPPSIVIAGKHDVRSQKDPSSDDNRHRAWGIATLGRSYEHPTKPKILDTIGSTPLAFPCDLDSAKLDCRSHRQGSRKAARMNGPTYLQALSYLLVFVCAGDPNAQNSTGIPDEVKIVFLRFGKGWGFR